MLALLFVVHISINHDGFFYPQGFPMHEYYSKIQVKFTEIRKDSQILL